MSAILAANAEEAKSRGRHDVHRVLMSFCVRLKQNTFLGEELESSVMENLGLRVEQAFAQGDFPKARVALSSLLAAMTRMHADPASEIAEQLAPVLMRLTHESAIAQQAKIGSMIIERALEKLESERDALIKEGWPSPSDTYDYVLELLKFFADELRQGEDPFISAEEIP